MIEIIPNWHPILVHFTVALFTVSVAFYVISYILKQLKSPPASTVLEFETVARWCLWVAAVITIGTALAGLYAFNTVKHDEISHIVMATHRNWALATASGIWLLAIWSGWCYYKRTALTLIFILCLLVVQGLLLTTAWYGGELVYRHGLGVMSLPQNEMDHHH